MRRLPTLLILILLAVIPTVALTPRSDVEVQSILDRLDGELANRDTHIRHRQHLIDSLHRQILKTNDLPSAGRLVKLYSSFNNDSALAISTRALEQARLAGDSASIVKIKLSRLSLLPLAGFVNQALNDLQSIDTAALSAQSLIDYYSQQRQMYSYISAFYHRFPKIHDDYNRRALEAQLRLIDHLTSNSPDYLLNQGEYHYLTGEYNRAEDLLGQLLKQIPEVDNRYARACHILSDIAAVRGSHNDRIYYLALSAIADTRGATREVTSLQELGQCMFERGDIERAHDYLYTALTNAVECNAETRMLQVAEAVPLIESVHEAELAASRRRIGIFIGFMIVSIVALLISLLYLRRKIRQMNRLQAHLYETNRVKEEYISQFLNLCSIYMDKLNQFCHIANRKISTGKVDDLYKLTKSGKFVENQTKEFYDVFDNAFIHIYPGFPEKVNSLLRDDAQIRLEEGQLLNTDLRILAFMRLGIDDSARIAQILNYSINTIYAYRNRLKSRAINRETFEADIASL